MHLNSILIQFTLVSHIVTEISLQPYKKNKTREVKKPQRLSQDIPEINLDKLQFTVKMRKQLFLPVCNLIRNFPNCFVASLVDSSSIA